MITRQIYNVNAATLREKSFISSGQQMVSRTEICVEMPLTSSTTILRIAAKEQVLTAILEQPRTGRLN
jgi:hypothetical protein